MPTCLFGFGGVCDGEDRLHVLGQRFAKSNGISGKSAAPVPLNCDARSNRFAAMGYPGDPHGVFRSLKRRDDRHTMPDLGQRKQRVRCATLQQDIGPDVGEAASRIEQDPDGIARVQMAMQQELVSLWQRAGFTALLVTHDVEEAVFLASRVIVLSERPARITAEVVNARPYPRHRGDPRLAELRREIMGHLGLAESW